MACVTVKIAQRQEHLPRGRPLLQNVIFRLVMVKQTQPANGNIPTTVITQNKNGAFAPLFIFSFFCLFY